MTDLELVIFCFFCVVLKSENRCSEADIIVSKLEGEIKQLHGRFCAYYVTEVYILAVHLDLATVAHDRVLYLKGKTDHFAMLKRPFLLQLSAAFMINEEGLCTCS